MQTLSLTNLSIESLSIESPCNNLVLEDLCVKQFKVDYSHPQTIQKKECVLHFTIVAKLVSFIPSFMCHVLYVCRASLQTCNGWIYGWMVVFTRLISLSIASILLSSLHLQALTALNTDMVKMP